MEKTKTKTFEFGKIDYNNLGRKTCPVSVEVTLYQDHNGRFEFSASGTIWNHLHTERYMCGQCLDTIRRYVNEPLFVEVYDLWERYHLNGMHAGTEEQEAAVQAWLESSGRKFDYDEVCNALRAVGLYEVDHDGKPYQYGHSWLHREIPDEALTRMKELVGWYRHG